MDFAQISGLISEAIVACRLLPGRKLNELELSKIFGVNRWTIRQALLTLQYDGLVEFEANRGAFVATPTLEEAHFLFEAIAAIEHAAVDLILAAPTPPSLDRLHAAHRKQLKAHEKEQMRASEQLAIDFHREFLALTGNPFLIDAHRRLLLRNRIITAVFRTALDYCALEDHHAQIIEWIENRARTKLHRLIDAHWHVIIRGHTNIQSGVDSLAEALRP